MQKIFNVFITVGIFLITQYAVAGIQEMDVAITDQDLSIKKITSKQSDSGDNLIIWVAPGFGTHQRAIDMSEKLAGKGVEVWHVDLAESLFLPKSTATMRKLDGRYLKGLIEYAHKTTGKNIILLTRSYGAIPVLRAMRLWQLAHSRGSFYLQGAILFSPELYSTIPALGDEPEFISVTEATNMPLMIFQGEKRGNRWQVKDLLNKLQAGGAAAYFKILKGVNGVFYSKDLKPATLKQVELMPAKIIKSIKLLSKTKKPAHAVKVKLKQNKKSEPLDIRLRPFRANVKPLEINLLDVFGKPYKKTDYKGKVTIVNFWATWCPPCVEEIPSLNHLRELMAGEKFELISINYGEEKDVIKKFMNKVNVSFPVLLDPSGKQAARWKVLVFPSTFVIGPDGTIKYGVNAAIHWDKPAIINELKNML